MIDVLLCAKCTHYPVCIKLSENLEEQSCEYFSGTYGKWIEHDYRGFLGMNSTEYECSVCGTHGYTQKSMFCPACGARMANFK